MQLIISIEHKDQTTATLTSKTFNCPNEIVIGRDSRCDLTLACRNKVVSRKHLKIKCNDQHIYLTDLSTNGTYVNKESAPIGHDSVRKIESGDTLTLGAYTLSLTICHSHQAAQDSVSADEGDHLQNTYYKAEQPEHTVKHSEVFSHTLGTHFAPPRVFAPSINEATPHSDLKETLSILFDFLRSIETCFFEQAGSTSDNEMIEKILSHESINNEEIKQRCDRCIRLAQTGHS